MKIFTLITALFFTLTSLTYGQIGKKLSLDASIELVGEVDLYGGQGYTINGKASVYRILSENKFVLSFQNQDFKVIDKIASIPFLGTYNDLDYLFKELRSCFKSPKEVFNIKVGEFDVQFSNHRGNEILVTTEQGYFSTTAAGLYSLFGKKWNKQEFRNYLKG